MRRPRVTPLPVEHADSLRTVDLLDLYTHPFDRLLIAQAQSLGVPIITVDDQIAAYDVTVVTG